MQVQEIDGCYKKPEPHVPDKLKELLKDVTVKRVLVFAAYGEDGKPTLELRRAWRRHNRTIKR